MKTLAEFNKTKDFLVCVDSDGCAMDTMDIKHFNCFGPCMVEQWELSEWADPILHRWNDINLYTMTRGINRFKGLAIALTEVNERYREIEGLDELIKWADNAPELSNAALERHIRKTGGNICLDKALAWSYAVNLSINKLPEEKKLPFKNAKEALAFAHERADVAVISSANPDAVLEEWAKHGLLDHVDVVLAQDAGSKEFCIGELMKFGYDKAKAVMCGDAPGDKQAAEKNGIYFYPILVKDEQFSWTDFIEQGFDKLVNGEFGGEYQDHKIKEFYRHLGAE